MSEPLRFHFPIAILSRDGEAITSAAEKHAELTARLPAGNVTQARALIGQVAAGITGQKGKLADVGTLTAAQNASLQTLRTWMSRARQTATLAFAGQTVKLHEEFQVGVTTPTDLGSILTRADIILAALNKTDNLAALKLKGWLDADTGVTYSEHYDAAGNFTGTDTGVFGLTSQQPGGNAPKSLVNTRAVVTSVDNRFKLMFADGQNFLQVDPGNDSVVNAAGTYSYAPTTANAGVLNLNYAAPEETSSALLQFFAPNVAVFTNADSTVGAAVFK